MSDTDSRSPKPLGDFGEGLATYALIRKGFEVACIDHVGADLIAQKDSFRIAVSVKTRRYRSRSIETRGQVIEYGHVKKLERFAERFQLEPVIAIIICIDDDSIIHLFMLKVSDVKTLLDKVKLGYRLRFGPSDLEATVALPHVDYSCWKDETIGNRLFVSACPDSVTRSGSQIQQLTLKGGI